MEDNDPPVEPPLAEHHQDMADDDIVIEEELSSERMPKSRNAAAIFASPDVETHAPFIPPGLSSFVAQAKRTLRDTQVSLQGALQSPPPKTQDVSMDVDEDSDNYSMKEDDDDRQLKRDVLDKFRTKAASNADGGDLTRTPADSAKKLFVESEEKGTPKAPETPPSPRASDKKLQSFWTQAMKPTPEKELRVSPEKNVSTDAPKTPPSPRASEGSPSFWSEAIKPEPEHELHVAPEEEMSAKAPETPPSPRASEGSPSFWKQPMKPEPAMALHVSPRIAINAENPATPPSPRASTGSHSFWGQAMGSSGAKVTSESKSSTPTKSNVSKFDDDDAAASVAPSPSVSTKSESKEEMVEPAPSKPPLMVRPPSSAAKLDVMSSPSPIESPQSSVVRKDTPAKFVQAAAVPSPPPVKEETEENQGPAMSTSIGAPETDDAVPKAVAVATEVKEVSKELPQESPSSVTTMDRPPLSSPSPLQATPKPGSITQATVSPASEGIQFDPASKAESEQTRGAASLPPHAPLDTPTPRKAPPAASSQSKLSAVKTPLVASPLQNAETPKVSESSPASNQVRTPIAPSPPGVTKSESSPATTSQSTARVAPLTPSSSRSKKEATPSAETPTVASPSAKGPSSEGSRSIPPSAKKSASTPLASMWNMLSSTKVAPSPIAPLELDDAPAEKKAEDASAKAPVAETSTEGTAPTETTVDDLAFLPNREAALPVERKSPQSKTASAAPSYKETAVRKKAFKSSVARPRVASNSTRTTASIQSTSSTASSALRTTTTSTNVPNRLMQGAAAGRARKGPSSQSTRNETSPDDGVAKARDRVKMRMQAKKAKDGAATAAKGEAQSSTKKPSISADDGRARARERVRQRQLQAKAKQEQAKTSQPMDPASRPSGSARAKQPTTTSRVPDYMRATASMQGRTSSGRQDHKTLRDDNPITRAFGSPTHDDKKAAVDTRVSRSERPRQLTVPQAPRLSTSSKYGDKPPPTVSGPGKVQPLQTTPRSTQGVTTPRPFHLHETKTVSTPAARQSMPAEPSLAGSVDFMKKGLRQETPATSIKRESKLTMPKPFHFHESKHAHHPPPSEGKAEPSLAESVDMFMRKGLRDETPASKPAKREPKLTIPEAPKFAPIAKRAVPKSTAEKEEEMMKEFNSRPFKAQPVPNAVVTRRSAPLPPKAPTRSVTEPVPFHFRVDTRGAAAKPPQGTLDKEHGDLEECKKQFHARPLPRMERQAPPKREPVGRPLTTPKPFNLATEKRGATAHVVAPSEDEIELKKQFHALPLPQSMYVSPAVSSSRKPTTQPQLSTPASAVAGPPKLATSSRTERREAARLESMKNAERNAKEKETMALRKQREKHHEEMVKASIRSPLAMKPVQPFHLRSESRHEAYQNQLAEQRLHEEQENRRRMSFHAKPLPKLSPPIKIQADHPRTEPRPFQLRSLTRHEMAQRSIRQHVEEEERERDSMTKFKARPIPLSTYEYHPVTPGQKKPLVQPFSPEFQLKQRAVERREFDEYAEHERERDASRKRAIQERLQAEELEELQEKRNLPVSEGGMIPKAKPINAVFLKTESEEMNESFYSMS